MADHCGICDTRRPEGGTKILVLNGGALWLEFCPKCADEPITNAETGETIAVGTLFAQVSGLPDTNIIPRATSRIAERIASEAAEEAYWAEQDAIAEEELRLEQLDAPTWYEVLGEFVLGCKQRTPRNLRALILKS